MKKLVIIFMAVWLGAIPLMARDDAQTLAGAGPDRGADCLQYLPMVFPEVMKISGVPTRSGWGRLVVSQGVSVVLMAGSVYSLKKLVTSRRPDRSDYDSFPSGHSAWAFAGATVVAKELGWRSPWYAVGAYAFATGVAMERVIDRHHSAIDAVCGAAIGVGMTQLGYLITDRIYGSHGLCERYRLSVQPTAMLDIPAGRFGKNVVTSLTPGIIVSCEF